MRTDNWEEARGEIAYQMKRIEVDRTRVQVDVGEGRTRLVMRLDHVGAADNSEIWSAMRVNDPELKVRLLVHEPYSLAAGWRLPLSQASSIENERPPVLVWKARDASYAAELVSLVINTASAANCHRISIESDECTGRELDRRYGIEAIRRTWSSKARQRASITECIRCGLPLSDPESVKLRIGPECRGYYSKPVLSALRSRKPPRLQAVRPKVWVKSIQSEWDFD